MLFFYSAYCLVLRDCIWQMKLDALEISLSDTIHFPDEIILTGIPIVSLFGGVGCKFINILSTAIIVPVHGI